MFVLVSRVAAFGNREYDSDSESEDSSEEDNSGTGFFATDFVAGFDFEVFVACREGTGERGAVGKL